jgi:hypothetical protein|eukprot:COSAG01_NODE_886_length_12921_cov_115.252652_14_plen_95_part_00
MSRLFLSRNIEDGNGLAGGGGRHEAAAGTGYGAVLALHCTTCPCRPELIFWQRLAFLLVCSVCAVICVPVGDHEPPSPPVQITSTPPRPRGLRR